MFKNRLEVLIVILVILIIAAEIAGFDEFWSIINPLLKQSIDK
jgi:hypothetical protein